MYKEILQRLEDKKLRDKIHTKHITRKHWLPCQYNPVKRQHPRATGEYTYANKRKCSFMNIVLIENPNQQ